MSEKILILGDICPDKAYRQIFDQGQPAMSNDLVMKMKQSFTVANLECPATDSMTPITKCGPSLKCKKNDVKILKEAGLNVVSLANNHILDYGVKGIEDTVEALEKNEVDYWGIGETAASVKKSFVKKIGNKTIGFMSFAEHEFNLATEDSPGTHLFDPYDSLDDIRSLKEAVDYLIVLYHGGIEHYPYPSPLLQKKCRKMAEVGADLVLCQHSHCIGTIEPHQNSTIVYGQGNTSFGYRENDRSWNEGLAIELDVNDLSQITYHLLKATATEVILDSEDNKNKRLSQIMNDSQQLSDPQKIKNNWESFVDQRKALNYPLLYGRSKVFNKMNRLTNHFLVKKLYAKKAQMITMNLIRCEAHNEVITTMLEKGVYDDKK